MAFFPNTGTPTGFPSANFMFQGLPAFSQPQRIKEEEIQPVILPNGVPLASPNFMEIYNQRRLQPVAPIAPGQAVVKRNVGMVKPLNQPYGGGFPTTPEIPVNQLLAQADVTQGLYGNYFDQQTGQVKQPKINPKDLNIFDGTPGDGSHLYDLASLYNVGAAVVNSLQPRPDTITLSRVAPSRVDFEGAPYDEAKKDILQAAKDQTSIVAKTTTGVGEKIQAAGLVGAQATKAVGDLAVQKSAAIQQNENVNAQINTQARSANVEIENQEKLLNVQRKEAHAQAKTTAVKSALDAALNAQFKKNEYIAGSDQMKRQEKIQLAAIKYQHDFVKYKEALEGNDMQDFLLKKNREVIGSIQEELGDGETFTSDFYTKKKEEIKQSFDQAVEAGTLKPEQYSAYENMVLQKFYEDEFIKRRRSQYDEKLGDFRTEFLEEQNLTEPDLNQILELIK